MSCQHNSLTGCSDCNARALDRENDRLRAALMKIDSIRNSIVGAQAANWSEHIYPLVAALEEAGYKGEPYESARKNVGTLIERATKAEARVAELETELARRTKYIQPAPPAVIDALLARVPTASVPKGKTWEQAVADGSFRESLRQVPSDASPPVKMTPCPHCTPGCGCGWVEGFMGICDVSKMIRGTTYYSRHREGEAARQGHAEPRIENRVLFLEERVGILWDRSKVSPQRTNEPEISDDILEARVFIVDEVCTWLACTGQKVAADLLHEKRNLFLLARPRAKTPEPESPEHFLGEREAHLRFYLSRSEEESVEASVDGRVILGASIADIIVHIRKSETATRSGSTGT